MSLKYLGYIIKVLIIGNLTVHPVFLHVATLRREMAIMMQMETESQHLSFGPHSYSELPGAARSVAQYPPHPSLSPLKPPRWFWLNLLVTSFLWENGEEEKL